MNNPPSVEFEDGIKERCPRLRLGILACGVINSADPADLPAEIDRTARLLTAGTALDETRRDPRIAAARAAYKACGKDPNRYRPSAEALRRRLVLGKGIYRVNTIVDILNLVSLRSGFSIGGFDADRVAGELRCGIGRRDEPYDAIGRGPMNIEGLPVLRDRAGPLGTPTSDHERTRVEGGTRRFLMVFYDFGGDAALEPVVEEAGHLLASHAAATDIARAIAY